MAHLELPFIFRDSSPKPQLLAQGAEALLYRTHFLNPQIPCVLKYRPPKKWRHPTLDARLTRHRILAEARILVKCRREGVRVPAVLALDWEGGRKNPVSDQASGEVSSATDDDRTGGWMMVEWISGGTVRAALNSWTELVKGKDEIDWPQDWKDEILDLMRRIGAAVAKLHQTGMIHGDLTTSNLMLEPKETVVEQEKQEQYREPGLRGELVLIDFGLAAGALQEEDRAVDLYVLERAYGSTHPTIEDYFQEVLKAYGESFKGAKAVLRRLEDVRQRGRKRSMIG